MHYVYLYSRVVLYSIASLKLPGPGPEIKDKCMLVLVVTTIIPLYARWAYKS